MFAAVSLPCCEAIVSPALGGGGSEVRPGGVGTAPGCGGGELPSPGAVPAVVSAGVYLEDTVLTCVAVTVGVNASVGAAGLAPGCGAG